MAEQETAGGVSGTVPEPVDGKFLVGIDDTGVYVTAVAPQEGGKPVREPAVIDELHHRGISEFDRALLSKIIRTASGIPVKIAEPPAPPPEPEILVLVSRDRMEANLQIKLPRNARPLAVEEVFERVHQAGVTYGLDAAAITQAFERPGSRVICARGQMPENGENARIIYHIDMENMGKPTELEDGSVDFKNLNLFVTVLEGQVLAEKIPPTPGVPGTDVLGQPAFARPGRDIPFPIGKNVEVREGSKVVASKAGHFVCVNGKLHVVPVVEVNGDVDLSTGNIDFAGDVIVRGSVQTGFTVKAGGNVEIAGTVSGGIVEGRNILIRMGIQGMFRGEIRAIGNVTAKFVENATIYAGEDVIVNDVVLQSRICAGKRVLVEGRRGLIAGGSTSAGEEIRAKIAGTSMATATDLDVGVNPLLRDEYRELRKEIKRVQITLDQTVKGVALLHGMDVNSLPPEKQAMMARLVQAELQLRQQYDGMSRRIEEIELAFEEMKYGKIRIADTVFPGVKITVGTLVKPIREIVRFSSFFAENGEIKIGSYK